MLRTSNVTAFLIFLWIGMGALHSVTEAAEPLSIQSLPSNISFRSAGYDPYHTVTQAQGHRIVIRNASSFYKSFTLEFDRGLNHTRPEATAYPYGRAARNVVTGEYIGYHLQRSAGYAISDSYIYKLVRDNPPYSGIMTGSVQPNKTLTSYVAVVIPHSQHLPPGRYEDTVKVNFYSGLYRHGLRKIETRTVTVVITVQSHLSFDLDSGNSLVPDVRISFSELTTNKEKSFYLNYKTNRSVELKFESDNKGKLKHTGRGKKDAISYTSYFDSFNMNLTNSRGFKVQSSGGNPRRVRMRFKVGTVNQNLTQGTYQDIIKLTIKTL